MAAAYRSLTAAIVLLASLALGACSLMGPSGAPPPAATPPANVIAAPAPGGAAATAPAVPGAAPPREHHLGAASQSLVTQARAQLLRGDLASATVTLERALKIEPANPLLWVELARVALAADDPRRAEGYGRKALALAAGDGPARAQASRVLAETLRAQHRDQEARELEASTAVN